MHSDPIADMLTRIRNAAKAEQATVVIKASGICQGVLRVLLNEGYISGFDKIDDATGQGILKVELKYAYDGTPAITEVKRVSKTGRRVYSPVKNLPYVMNGMGIAVVSTNKGVMTDKQCRVENVSGEILCMVS
ncbi:MAG: 30S ribosomal protein S8 [Phycisphaerae bacterium]|nr:30S ribosomal protein S8 [Phycisphaerae bacterium]